MQEFGEAERVRDADWEARMKDDPVNNYAIPMELDDVIVGESVARVIQFNTPPNAVGDLATVNVALWSGTIRGESERFLDTCPSR